MPNFAGVAGLESTSIFVKLTLPAYSEATSSTIGANHFAWTAPFRPEIDQYRFVGFQYICFKGSIADSFDIVSHDVLEKRGEYQLKKYPKMFIGDIWISVDS